MHRTFGYTAAMTALVLLLFSISHTQAATLQCVPLDGSGSAAGPAPDTHPPPEPQPISARETTQAVASAPDQTESVATANPSNPTATERPDRCDETTSPPAFLHAAGVPGAIRLDVRPGNCQSHFDNPEPMARGQAIEQALPDQPLYVAAITTTQFSPLIDYVQGNTAISVQSHDLGRTGFNNAGDALENAIIERADRLSSELLQTLENGETFTVDTPDGPLNLVAPMSVTLDIVIQHGIATATQIATLNRLANSLPLSHGIGVRVIEIP